MSEGDIKLRLDQARGFAAMKVLLDEREADITRLQGEVQARDVKFEKLLERVTTLEANHLHVKEHVKEQTGRYVKVAEDGLKAQGALEVKKEDQKNWVETWKATAPIVVAVVSGIFGLVSGVVALLSTFLGH